MSKSERAWLTQAKRMAKARGHRLVRHGAASTYLIYQETYGQPLTFPEMTAKEIVGLYESESIIAKAVHGLFHDYNWTDKGIKDLLSRAASEWSSPGFDYVDTRDGLSVFGVWDEIDESWMEAEAQKRGVAHAVAAGSVIPFKRRE